MIKKNEFYKRNPKVIFHEVESELFILDEKNDEVVKLNNTGKILWQALRKTQSLSMLVELLQKDYEAKEGEIAKDITNFLNLLLLKKLIIPSLS